MWLYLSVSAYLLDVTPILVELSSMLKVAKLQFVNKLLEYVTSITKFKGIPHILNIQVWSNLLNNNRRWRSILFAAIFGVILIYIIVMFKDSHILGLEIIELMSKSDSFVQK